MVIASLAPADVHPSMERWIEADLANRGLSWEQMETGRYWGTERLPFKRLPELMHYVRLADPVNFMETSLCEQDEPGHPPWRLFPYQTHSARYRGDLLHQAGAEVGKSREIVGLSIWRLITQPGDQLIAAALAGQMEALYTEILWHLTFNPWLEAQIDWKRTKWKPYPIIQNRFGRKIHFRPVGSDGAQLRSLHVRGAAYLDEAASVSGKKADTAYDNFFARCKPGCERRIYAVPDGSRATPYYRLCAKVPEVDCFNLPAPKRGRWIKVRWPKTLMPEPWWDEEREREAIEQYGGVESSGYQQNVLGNHGNPSDTVFPWSDLKAILAYLPEYRCLKLLKDADAGTVRVEGYSLNPHYVIRAAAGDEGTEGALSPTVPLVREVLGLAPFGGLDQAQRIQAWRQLFKRLLPIPSGHLAIGVDLGSVSDPTEILIARVRDGETQWISRIQLRAFDYSAQADMIYALEDLLRPSHGWGLDTTGGPPVEELIRRPARLSDRRVRVDYQGMVLNSTTVRRDAEGAPLIDPKTGDELKINLKELGVQRLELGVQRRKIEAPFDPDLMIEFPDFRAEILPTGRRKFSKTGDHLVAAAICLHLRLHEMGGRSNSSLPAVSSGPRHSWTMFGSDA